MRSGVKHTAPSVRNVRDYSDKLERIHELDRSLASALDAERHHAARGRSVKLLLHELLVRRVRKSGEIDPCDLFLRLEPLGDLESALGMAADAHMERFKAKIQQIRIERRCDCPEVAHQMGGAFRDVGELAERLRVGETVIRLIRLYETRKLVGMLLPVEVAAVDDASANLRGVSIHVLRRGVGDDVAAEVERTAENRSGERVVDDERHTILVGDLRELGDVQNYARGICDSFSKHALGVRAKRLLNLSRGGLWIDEREFDSDLLERHGKEIERAAVDLRRRYDMVSGIAEVENGERRSRLA